MPTERKKAKAKKSLTPLFPNTRTTPASLSTTMAISAPTRIQCGSDCRSLIITLTSANSKIQVSY
jgi:hypothetical protein